MRGMVTPRQAVETYEWTPSTTVTVTPVPEPGTAAQALLGLALLAGGLWRRAAGTARRPQGRLR